MLATTKYKFLVDTWFMTIILSALGKQIDIHIHNKARIPDMLLM